jgi:hypothetical protein
MTRYAIEETKQVTFNIDREGGVGIRGGIISAEELDNMKYETMLCKCPCNTYRMIGSGAMGIAPLIKDFVHIGTNINVTTEKESVEEIMKKITDKLKSQGAMY